MRMQRLSARITGLGLAACVVAGLATTGTPASAKTIAHIPAPPRLQAAGIDPLILAGERAASARARASHKKVLVDVETTPSSEVTANPDGTFTLTETSSPVRVNQHGRWVPVDTRLVRLADGSIAPRATVTGVFFSGGGNAPMVTLTQGRDELSFSFPVRLPAPSISGPTAMYRDVMPGVDLELTADVTGFSEVLVVRNRAAAASPGLARLTSRLGTRGLRIRGVAGGTAVAVDASGRTVFHSDQAEMWDSAGVPVSKSAAAGPARGGHMARVAVTTGDAAESLIPDRSLLTGPKTRFPVYIDPVWSGNPSQIHWARISSNGWNIYDSTSTGGADHPRAGFDGWLQYGGANELARTYYQVTTGGDSGTSGIRGAIVTSADFFLNDNWAASSWDTPVDLYWSCAPIGNNWNSTDLNWGNKPCENTRQGELNSHENSNGTVSPGTFDFGITGLAQSAANGNWGTITFEVRAPDESTTDGTSKDQWKQFQSGGGAWMSVTYMRRPDFVNGTGNPTTTPSSTDNGTTFVTSPTPTLNITAEDTDGENVQTAYQVWQGDSGNPSTLVAQGSGPSSGYAPNGGPWTVSNSLADGVYEWRASATNPISSSNPQGLWTGWSDWHVFTVDTTVPNAPSVESPQYPVNQYGAAFGTTGAFTFGNDLGDNVMGYMFSLDGDMSTAVYNPASPPPTWTGSGTPVAGKVYWLEADNNDGTGAEQTNGFAAASITPTTTGPHRVYAKAVDQAGNTSAQYIYTFYAGITTPAYVYGDQLVHGYTAADGTSVPPATWVTKNGAILTTQPSCCGANFADGEQAYLTYGPGAPALGDTATMHFYIPSSGYWDIGANLTTSDGYGEYTLTLDQGSPAPATLITGFDAWRPPTVVVPVYRDLGIPRDAGGNAIRLAKGIHTLTLTMTGTISPTGEYKAGIDDLRLSPAPASCPITDLSGCANNTAISPDNNTNIGDADGWGHSFSQSALAAAGWTPGAALTIDGAPMTFPRYGNYVQDNVIPAGQTVNVPGTGVVNAGNAVVFLGFSTDTQNGVSGYTGHITYASGCTYGTSQSYTLDDVPDWIGGPASAQTLMLKYENQYGNVQSTSWWPQIFAVSVPLDFAGCQVASITLPVESNGLSGTNPAMHILALGIRPMSFTDSTNASNWTGTFAAKQDSPTSALGAVTIRMPVRVSVGGTQVRVHLANTLGTAPVTFDDASLAIQSSGAVPTGTPVKLTFNGGSGSVTIPAGGEVTSDPVTYQVSQEQTLLVSAHLAAAVSNPPAHNSADFSSYVSAAGTDAVMDTTGTPFTGTTPDLPYLTGIDITGAGNTTGSLVLYGDQTINSDTASGGASLADDLAPDLANANGGTVPYGVLSEGQNGWTPGNDLLPQVFGAPAPLSALNPADRSVLTAANVRTVLISTGTSDILHGAGASTVEAGLVALAQQIRAFYADSPVSNASGHLTVYVATIPPDSRFTAAEESVREAVNGYILNSSGAYLGGNADGAIDFAAAVSNTGTNAGTSVNPADLYQGYPDNAYYRALAQQYITSTNPTTGTVGIQPNSVRRAGAA